jgi:hypothetical protein
LYGVKNSIQGSTVLHGVRSWVEGSTRLSCVQDKVEYRIEWRAGKREVMDRGSARWSGVWRVEYSYSREWRESRMEESMEDGIKQRMREWSLVENDEKE